MASIRRPAVLLILLGLAAGPAFAGRSSIDPDGNPAPAPNSNSGTSEGRSSIDPDG